MKISIIKGGVINLVYDKINRKALIIPGPRRCGTTTLFEILERHPKVDSSTIKEPHFFLMGKNTIESNLNWYKNLYSKCREKYILDGTTTYFSSKDVFRKIRQYLDEVKILMILRDPVKRSYSAFWHMKSMVPSREKRDFEEILKHIKGPQLNRIIESENEAVDKAARNDQIDKGYLNKDYLRTKHGAPFESNFDDKFWPYKYFQESIYSKKVEFIKNLFSDVKIVFLEELIEYPEKTIKKIYEFIGSSKEVDNFNLPHENKSGLPNNLLAKKIEKIRNENKIARKIISSSKTNNRLLRSLYNYSIKTFFKSKPKLKKDHNLKAKKILQNEYQYWLKKRTELEKFWQ